MFPGAYVSKIDMRPRGARSGPPDHSARGEAMNFWESVRMSLAALWTHKLRSLLTLLGVIIAVTALIAWFPSWTA